MSDNGKDIQVWRVDEQVEDIQALIRGAPDTPNMTPEQEQALALYARALDANYLRGEMYATMIKGKLLFLEGYKLQIRWAMKQCKYTENFIIMSREELKQRGFDDRSIGYYCRIVREDQRDIMKMYVDMGATFAEALNEVGFKAEGIVSYNEMFNQQGRPISPPKGWSFHQVAQKRARKNALNLSHPAPSPEEMIKTTWDVGGTETIEADWQDVTVEEPALAEKQAQLAAIAREKKEADKDITPEEQKERLRFNAELMRGPVEEGIGEEEEVVLISSELGEIIENSLSKMEVVSKLLLQWGYPLQAHDKMSEAIFEKPLATLSEIELHNAMCYAERRAILTDTSLPIPERIKKIPEMMAYTPEKRPKTIKESVGFCKELAIEATREEQWMTKLGAWDISLS